jgi:hypothetical protein
MSGYRTVASPDGEVISIVPNYRPLDLRTMFDDSWVVVISGPLGLFAMSGLAGFVSAQAAPEREVVHEYALGLTLSLLFLLFMLVVLPAHHDSGVKVLFVLLVCGCIAPVVGSVTGAQVKSKL